MQYDISNDHPHYETDGLLKYGGMAVSQDNNGQSNRERILAAAQSLMAEKGIKKTSLADIARVVGISKGTLFYHFASKDDLVNDILADHFTNLVSMTKEHLPQHLENKTPSQILQMLFDQFTGDLEITRLDLYLLQEGIQGNDNINEKFVQRKRNWRKVIAEDLETLFQISNPVHVSALSTMILAIIDGLALQILVEPGSINTAEITATLAEMIDLLASREGYGTE